MGGPPCKGGLKRAQPLGCFGFNKFTSCSNGPSCAFGSLFFKKTCTLRVCDMPPFRSGSSLGPSEFAMVRWIARLVIDDLYNLNYSSHMLMPAISTLARAVCSVYTQAICDVSTIWRACQIWVLHLLTRMARVLLSIDACVLYLLGLNHCLCAEVT